MSLYRFARAAVNIYAKLFFRVEYHGRENEPQDKDKAIIVISNHSSFNDALFTANAVKRDLSFIIKSSLIKHPLLGKFLTACNTIPIDRGNSDMQAIRVACKSVAEGKSIGVYPQGTRIPGSPPKPEQAMAGIGLIASRSKASFLPVAIWLKRIWTIL